MKINRSWLALFKANFKVMYRNWRGLFWNIFLPVALYVGLSVLKIQTGISQSGTKINYSAYLLPGMIALTIVQTGIFSLAYWLIDLKERGVIKRFLVTPLSNTELLSALISTRLVIMLIQVVLLTFIGGYFFGVGVQGNIAAIIILCLLGGTVFLSLGFFISTVSATYDDAAPITTMLNLIFTFLGNVFFPTSILPKFLRVIGEKLPITYLADGLRINYVQKAGFLDAGKDMVALIIWVAVLFALAVWSFRRTQQA